MRHECMNAHLQIFMYGVVNDRREPLSPIFCGAANVRNNYPKARTVTSTRNAGSFWAQVNRSMTLRTLGDRLDSRTTDSLIGTRKRDNMQENAFKLGNGG